MYSTTIVELEDIRAGKYGVAAWARYPKLTVCGRNET